MIPFCIVLLIVGAVLYLLFKGPPPKGGSRPPILTPALAFPQFHNSLFKGPR